jgi:hypothetical protein
MKWLLVPKLFTDLLKKPITPDVWFVAHRERAAAATTLPR